MTIIIFLIDYFTFISNCVIIRVRELFGKRDNSHWEEPEPYYFEISYTKSHVHVYDIVKFI